MTTNPPTIDCVSWMDRPKRPGWLTRRRGGMLNGSWRHHPPPAGPLAPGSSPAHASGSPPAPSTSKKNLHQNQNTSSQTEHVITNRTRKHKIHQHITGHNKHAEHVITIRQVITIRTDHHKHNTSSQTEHIIINRTRHHKQNTSSLTEHVIINRTRHHKHNTSSQTEHIITNRTRHHKQNTSTQNTPSQIEHVITNRTQNTSTQTNNQRPMGTSLTWETRSNQCIH